MKYAIGYLMIGILLAELSMYLWRRWWTLADSESIMLFGFMVWCWPVCFPSLIYDRIKETRRPHPGRLLRRLRRKAIRNVDVRNNDVKASLENLLLLDLSRYNRDTTYKVRSLDERLKVLHRCYIITEISRMRSAKNNPKDE